MEELDLQDNVIEEISSTLSKFTKLKYFLIILFIINYFRSLHLSYNRIKKIEGLEQLSDLERLYLSCNIITKIDGIDNLKALRILELGFNRIEVHDAGFKLLTMPNRKSKD